jgi:hypothetical protein
MLMQTWIIVHIDDFTMHSWHLNRIHFVESLNTQKVSHHNLHLPLNTNSNANDVI